MVSLLYLLILIISHILHLKPFDFNTLKKLHEKGTSDRQTDISTTRLLEKRVNIDNIIIAAKLCKSHISAKYYRFIYKVLTWFASLKMYEDDIFKVISHLHVPRLKFGGKAKKVIGNYQKSLILQNYHNWFFPTLHSSPPPLIPPK